MPDPELLGRRTYEAADLMRRFPPAWAHPNKQLVAQLSCPPGRLHIGTISVSRWREAGLPESPPGSRTTTVMYCRGFFTYEGADFGDPAMHWHVNFADPRLFGFAEGPLLAQDELQVAEHPALLAVRQALAADGDPLVAPRTVEGSRATPVLVAGVERLCAIKGLYGNAFATASEAAVRRATEATPEGFPSNIVAISAPHGGRGMYTAADISSALRTAYAGFRAVALESPQGATLHTGFWGCGLSAATGC